MSKGLSENEAQFAAPRTGQLVLQTGEATDALKLITGDPPLAVEAAFEKVSVSAGNWAAVSPLKRPST